MMETRGGLLMAARRMVVKVGTSVLTERGGDQLSPTRVHAMAAQVARIHRAHREVIVVTSGAIAAGMRVLGYRHRPKDLPRLQAASAVGQGRLMHLYEVAFAEQGFHAAQLLLTYDDLRDRRRANVKATLETLLAAGMIPVINENDSVATDEIRVGDNDQLAAHVAILSGAQLLILLSDVNGFYKRPDDSAGVVFRCVHEITPELERLARDSAKATSTGGMRTKLLAAKMVMHHGIPLLLVNGHEAEVLTRAVLEGDTQGTVFTRHPLRE